MSVWHITHAVVFVVVLPFQLKSIPAAVVVALLLWQLTVAQVPPLAVAQTPLSSVLGSQSVVHHVDLRRQVRGAAVVPVHARGWCGSSVHSSICLSLEVPLPLSVSRSAMVSL